MLVYHDDKEDEEFISHQEYAYVYEYDDDYGYEEDSDVELNDYEREYDVSVDEFLIF